MSDLFVSSKIDALSLQHEIRFQSFLDDVLTVGADVAGSKQAPGHNFMTALELAIEVVEEVEEAIEHLVAKHIARSEEHGE